MVKHLVVWKLKDRAQAPEIKAVLDAMPAKIPQLAKLEVGCGRGSGEFVADLALYSEFATWADLATYLKHPAHQEVVAYLGPLVSERRVADYEV